MGRLSQIIQGSSVRNFKCSAERKGRWDTNKRGRGLVRPEAKECWQPEWQGTAFLLEPLKGERPCQNLDLGPGILILDFWPLEL